MAGSITRNPGSGHALEVGVTTRLGDEDVVVAAVRLLQPPPLCLARSVKRWVPRWFDVPAVVALLEALVDLHPAVVRGDLRLVNRELLGVALDVDLPHHPLVPEVVHVVEHRGRHDHHTPEHEPRFPPRERLGRGCSSELRGPTPHGRTAPLSPSSTSSITIARLFQFCSSRSLSGADHMQSKPNRCARQTTRLRSTTTTRVEHPCPSTSASARAAPQ